MTTSQKAVLFTLVKLVSLIVSYITSDHMVLSEIKKTQDDLYKAITLMD